MRLVSKSFAVALAILSSVFLVSALDAQDKNEPITIVSHVDIKPDAYCRKPRKTRGDCFAARPQRPNKMQVWSLVPFCRR